MKKLESLPKIIHTCMTIGEIPTSYKLSLTYEEQLMWFCKFLQDEVIPVVNNNSEAVQELQNYVANYFDNLDVQEEINNKLDEMADDGTLEEIITEYINLKSILAFNTKAEMKSATNLVDGSFTKTYGTTTYNDGYGEFYKIRTLLNTDVIDDDNIVALTNYPTLIAEKMPNTYINEINETIDDIEEDIEDIENYLYNEKILIIGDSFIGQYTSDNWAIRLCNKLGIPASNRTILGEGGAGIYNKSPNNRNFEDVLDLALPNITDKNLYKKIIIGGGTNDMNATSLDMILTPMQSLINKCKTNFPNAKIYIAEFGWFMNYANVLGRSRINGIVIPAYKQCTKYGAIYLNNVEYCYRDQNLYESTDPSTQDLVHPNTDGQEEIACAIYQALNGSYRPRYKSSNLQVPTTSDVTVSNLWFTDMCFEGKHIVNLNGGLTIAKSYTNSAISIDLGIIGNPFIRKTNDNIICFAHVPATLYSPTQGDINAMVRLDINNQGHFTCRIPEGLGTGFDITSIVFRTAFEFDQLSH